MVKNLLIPNQLILYMLKAVLPGLAVIAFLTGGILDALGDDFELTPAVSLREEYNDNIFFSTNDVESDFITTLAGSLELIERTERLNLSLFGKVAPFFYADNDDLDDTDQTYSGIFSYQFTPRYSVRIDGGYFLDNRPDRDISATGLVTGTDQRRRWRFGLDTAYQLTEISGLRLRYYYLDDKWKERNPEHEDLTAHDIGLSYNHEFAGRLGLTTGSLDFGYGRYDFETSLNKTLFGSVGVYQAFSRRLSLNATVGARYVDSNFDVQEYVQISPGVFQLQVGDESKQGSGMFGRGDLRYSLSEKSFSILSFLRDIEPASSRGTLVVRTELVFFWNHKFTDNLAGALTAGVYRNEADQDEFSFRELDQNLFRISPSVRWKFFKNFSLEAGYSYVYANDRSSGGSDADQNRVWAQIAYGLPLLSWLESSGPVSKWPGFQIETNR